MKKILIIILISFAIIGTIWHGHKKSHYPEFNPPVIAYSYSFYDNLKNTEPLQENLNDSDLRSYEQGNFNIKTVQRYRIVARVLHRQDYSYQQTHEILPIDLVLGWNVMANPDTITSNHIIITQQNRFYFWHIPSFEKISREQIEYNSANTHVGAVNEIVKKELEDIKEGDLIYLEGYLVNVIDKKTGYRFVSSLTRKDTGAGACEVMIVTGVKELER